MKITQIMANCITIEENDIIRLVSYDKVIACKYIHTDAVVLDPTYWNYSKTTGKHRNWFLGETYKDTQYKVDNGIYYLSDLN